jgi:hypothetical protein
MVTSKGWDRAAQRSNGVQVWGGSEMGETDVPGVGSERLPVPIQEVLG